MSDANTTAEDMADQEPDDQQATSNSSGGEDADAVETSPEPTAESGDAGSKLVTVVEYAAFGILCLLALVATFRFYFAASEAIRIWFDRDWVPVFQAAFNLVVLVAAALGISVLVRRIAAE